MVRLMDSTQRPLWRRLGRATSAAAASTVAVALLASTLATPDRASAPSAEGSPSDLSLVSAEAKVYRAGLAKAINGLRRAPEVRTGYDRRLFKHWVDADKNGCDTRREVLIAEARRKPTVGSRCSLTGGRWVSYFDGVATRDPAKFDIDHLVPLAESWDSGARTWDADTRERFANDLDDPRSLVAVSAKSNRSKADRDPAEWLPPRNQCRYIKEWVAVKHRWSLTAEAREKKALRAAQNRYGCSGVVRVTKAPIVRGTTTTPTQSSAGTLKVTKIVFDPPGPDTTENANDEYVVVTNSSTVTVHTAGWTLLDAANHKFTFSARTVAPGASLTVRSGSGTDTPTALHAGWGHVWNNTGDIASVIRPDGTYSDNAAYTSSGNSTGQIEF